MKTLKNREVICAISKQDAMYCMATSADGVHAEVACPAGNGFFLPPAPVLRSAFEGIISDAGELVCICNDTSLPGYEVAFYDTKYERWTRLKTNSEKVSAILEREKRSRKNVCA